MKRDILSVLDLKDDMGDILKLASKLKKETSGKALPLKGKSLAMIFEKSSTRTRVSFEVGMTQLGGDAIHLSPKDTQMGRGETIADTARTLSRYVDAIMYRAFKHEMMLELAQYATVPVINALDDLEHPCQIAADLLTIKEKLGTFQGKKLAYMGDGNNVCNSLLLGAAVVGMDAVAACPEGYHPNPQLVSKAIEMAKSKGSSVKVIKEPKKAAEDADVIYTDVWVSMGDEAESKARERDLRPYQVNSSLLKKAKEDCIVMHCLPAHRGQEITTEVIDGPQSVVFDEAENRLHAQKAILITLMT